MALANRYLLTGTAIGISLFGFFTASVYGQGGCLTTAEAGKVIASMNASNAAVDDKKVRKELIEMQDERQKVTARILADLEKNKALISKGDQLAETQLLRVCQLLKEKGWFSGETLQPEVVNALGGILTNNRAYEAQRELLPVLVEAAKKGLIDFPMIATMVDSIRVGFGQPQIFGTQARIKGDLIELFPLLNDEKVDEWRKEYKLAPLAFQIKRLEAQYTLPVLKSQRKSGSQMQANGAGSASDTAVLGISTDENEPVKVVTKVVNLNVRVLSRDPKALAGPGLSKNDFHIAEDGTEQEITFFTTTEEPFDLVLILDFSGSTVPKRDLIKKAAQRFVEYARAHDRIAIVAFATDIEIVSGLTTDKTALNDRIKNIKIQGGSPIWESVKFTYENIIRKESFGRRSAIVLMSDGVDGSRNTTFAELMEVVRGGDTTIFSVYVNTGFGSSNGWMDRMAKLGQETMSMLAEETGGEIYKAKGINDLKGIYEQVVNDLGKVFTIGYEPKNELRDGGWRDVSVKIKTRPELTAKTRRGYYAN
jgi:VWFA-related protein